MMVVALIFVCGSVKKKQGASCAMFFFCGLSATTIQNRRSGENRRNLLG